MSGAFEIQFAFNRWTLGDEFLRDKLGIRPELYESPTFDLLTHLGFTRAHIAEASEYVCGTMMRPRMPEAISQYHLGAGAIVRSQ